MTKEALGKDCKVCSRPYTLFKWNPGKNTKQRKTELCQLCAKLKNVCQSCILDLDYGLPSHLRDAVLNTFGDIPTSGVNTEYYVQNIANQTRGDELVRTGKADSTAKDMLRKMSRQDPYYEKNKLKVCFLFTKGQCAKGSSCPYRHEIINKNYKKNISYKPEKDKAESKEEEVSTGEFLRVYIYIYI
jgi:pre-mRNA-splicing factor RBM22/SLT11